MLKEFREFIAKGNVLDLAVAVLIGAAFGTIVTSLVKDVIMPPIGLGLGHLDFNNLMIVLKEGTPPAPYGTPADAAKAAAVTINYGAFLNTIINFLIVAFVIFLIVRAANKLKKPQEVKPVGPTKDQELLTEIRDLLAKRG